MCKHSKYRYLSLLVTSLLKALSPSNISIFVFKMSYDREVKLIFGEVLLNEIQHYARGNVIDKKVMCEIAKGLDAQHSDRTYLFGKHDRRMKQGKEADHIEMKQILSDWYGEGLFQMIEDVKNVIDKERDEVLKILITIFRDVPINPLVKSLESRLQTSVVNNNNNNNSSNNTNNNNNNNQNS